MNWRSAFAPYLPTPNAWLRSPTLEDMLTRPDGFGLEQASNVQRAICRVLDGRPLGLLADDPDVIECLGGHEAIELYRIGQFRPVSFLLLAGIRSGKSLIVAACAVRAALTCDLSQLGPGEVPRVSILSLTVDTARATWAHVHGRIAASEALRTLLAEEPTADRIVLRRPSDGRLVEIRVVAGSKAAGSLVARWSAGVIFDEAPRMVGAEDGVVNLDDARQSVAGRLLPGAQILMVGSVWAPFGPTYELEQKHFGAPSGSVFVVKATGPQMNPSWWTLERCEKLKETDPDAYAVDVLNQYMQAAQGIVTLSQLIGVARAHSEPIPPSPLHHYTAHIDPATRGNSWTLVVATRNGNRDGKPFVPVVLAKQWTGSAAKPLSPRATLLEVKEAIEPYRLHLVTSDQWAIDTIRELASDVGLQVMEDPASGPSNVEMYKGLQTAVIDRTIELPNDNLLLRDLTGVRRRVTQTGITIELQKTADGRHCDYAPVVARARAAALQLPDSPPVDPDSPEARAAYKAERIRQLRQGQRRTRVA